MALPVRPEIIRCAEMRKAAPRFIQIGSRRYRRFLRDGAADDGTVRCFSCGQVDEPKWHDPLLCPAMVMK